MSAESKFEKEMERLQRDGVISRTQFLQIMAAAGALLALGTDKAYAAKSGARAKIVIVGGGAAGISMASQLLRKLRNPDITIIDPLMSIGVAVFIIINAARNLKEALDLFLEKAPHGIDVAEIKEHLLKIDGILDVHHIHVWSLDGQLNYATLHAVTSADPHHIKHKIREELAEHGISHVTIELEAEGEHCHETDCRVEHSGLSGHHHHHHHHGHGHHH